MFKNDIKIEKTTFLSPSNTYFVLSQYINRLKLKKFWNILKLVLFYKNAFFIFKNLKKRNLQFKNVFNYFIFCNIEDKIR